MNIFRLSNDPKEAAIMQHDRHIIKMILESAQMLSTACRVNGRYHPNIYNKTHQNHPCTLWVTRSNLAFQWLVDHGMALCDEMEYRFGTIHKSKAVIQLCSEIRPKLPDVEIAVPLAMPDQYKVKGDSVTSYRNFYLAEKMQMGYPMGTMSRWTKRNLPEWCNES
jgi:hypothetical protein